MCPVSGGLSVAFMWTHCLLFVCSDLDRQLCLGVDAEFCVITSSIPISPLSQGISVRRPQGQAGEKKMSIIHPVPPLTCHIYFLGGCMDNESLPLYQLERYCVS